MIKILNVTPRADTTIGLVFSDGSTGEFDLTPMITINTVLTAPLADAAFRNTCYLELGALCWPNGLELSAASLHHRLKADGKLRTADQAA